MKEQGLKIFFARKNLDLSSLNQEFERLVNLCFSINYEEVPKFEAYIKFSPFKSNGGANLDKLFAHIATSIKKGTAKVNGNVLLKKLFSETSPTKTPEDLEQRLKELYDCMLEFIAVNQIRGSKILKQRILLEDLRRRNNQSIFEAQGKRFKKLLKDEPLSIHIAENLWWINHQFYYRQNSEQHSSGAFYDCHTQLEQFIQLAALRNYAEHLNRQALLIDENPPELSQMLVEFSINRSADVPVIEAYKRIVTLFKSVEYNDYLYFKSHINENSSEISKEDLLALIKFAINWCVIQFDNKRILSPGEVLHWIKILDEKRLYIIENTISENEFLNAINTIASNRDFDYLSDFINRFEEYLDASSRESTINLANAYSLYHHSAFEKVIQVLDKYFPLGGQYPHRYNLHVKTLRIRCYLELNETSGDFQVSFEKSASNFEKYLKRQFEGNKLNKYYFEGYMNLIQLSRLLYSYPFALVENKEKLKGDILSFFNSNENIKGRAYFQRKLSQL